MSSHSVHTICTQVCCSVRPQTAHAQLCAEHPVLHDVWGDGAHLAHHGEQPENGGWEYDTQRSEKNVTLCFTSWPSVFFLLQASNIDDVLCHHTSFLDNCLKDCMLTNPELLRIFSKLMSVCVKFTNCMQVCWHNDKEEMFPCFCSWTLDVCIFKYSHFMSCFQMLRLRCLFFLDCSGSLRAWG